MKEKNIKCISNVKMCSACGACVSICPTKAISYEMSSIGRIYTCVNDKCIQCGRCLNVCPSNNYCERKDFFDLDKERIVVGKSTNLTCQINGQSGGAVTSVLSYLFRNGKIDAVLLCKPDANGHGKPIVVTSEDDLFLCQKSIYTPVTLLNDVDLLSHYTSVAIVGLPCHLYALELLQKYKSLPIKYKIGLICDRTLCKSISDGILNYLGSDSHVRNGIIWRDKSVPGYSYHNAPISITLPDGSMKVLPTTVRQKLKLYVTPPRCLVCPDKLNLSADLVFGDPWNVHNKDPRGESLIIANNLRGDRLLQEVIMSETIAVVEVTKEQLVASQHIPERKKQVALYASLFNLVYKCRIFASNDARFRVDLAIIKESLRALYIIGRFNVLERLPSNWVTRYLSNKIMKFCKNQ